MRLLCPKYVVSGLNYILNLHRSYANDLNDPLACRTSRPHVELTHDLPLEGLVSEVKAIKDSIHMLEDKLDNAR